MFLKLKDWLIYVYSFCTWFQVQRCYEDMSILITTYEGTHNHPLPFTASSMASTTAAAASMLLSGSSTSQPGFGSTATLLNGSDFGVFNSSRTNQLYLPKSSNPLLPTITLDLTASPSSSPIHLNRLSSSFASACPFPSSLSFCSSESNISPNSRGNGYLKYGSLPFDKGSFNLDQPYAEKNQQSSSQLSLTESLTKAITSDPNFKSVIAVALSSMVGGGAATHRNQGEGERLGHHLKWSEAAHQFTSHNPLIQNGKRCSTPSIFNRLSSSDSQKWNVIHCHFPDYIYFCYRGYKLINYDINHWKFSFAAGQSLVLCCQTINLRPLIK